MSEIIIAAFTAGLFLATVALCYFTAMMVQANNNPLPLVTIAPAGYGFELEIENVGTATAFDVSYETIPKKGIPVLGNPKEIPLPFEKISILKPKQKYRSYIGSFDVWKDQNFHISVSWFDDLQKKKKKNVQYSMSTHHTNSLPGKDFEKEVIKNSDKIARQFEKTSAHLRLIGESLKSGNEPEN